MGKEEIALQLTLKAMDAGKAGLESAKLSSMENAKKVYEFYNEIFMNLQVSQPDSRQ